MSKRKREAETISAIDHKGSAERELDAQEKQLESVLERSKQTLHQALKLAKGLERQKLGRRQKTAKAAQDDGDSKRLAAEVVALKTNSISSASMFPSWIKTKLYELSKPQESAHANVQARLLNSQPVKKAMNDSMGSIRALFGVDEPRDGKRKRLRKADYQRQSTDISKNSIPIDRNAHGPVLDTGSGSCAADEVQLHDTNQADSSDDDINFDAYDSRLVGSSGDSFDGFSEATGSDEMRTYPGEDTSRSPFLSPSPSSPESPMTADPAIQDKMPVLEKPNTNAKGTTFLPSLMMGGYWSGSESASDDEVDAEKPQRQNRRGQQERRLIAEKKFGQNANHLKKQRKASDRDDGWDARRGAQSSGGKDNQRRGGGRTNRTSLASRFTKGAASSSGANSDPVGPGRTQAKSQAPEAPLHPSWQAAKTAKEHKMAATFQGKKVVFD
ncbi:MAG: hypothetical protein Q9216_006104 [Gyalolechia sp. 2 TL-2023]